MHSPVRRGKSASRLNLLGRSGRMVFMAAMLSTLALSSSAVHAQGEVKLVFFTLEGCQPCQQMRPALAQLQSAGWQVDYVDAAQRPDLTQQLEVRNAPTILIWGPRGEIDRVVGVTSMDQIAKRLSRAAARYGFEPSRAAGSSASSTMRIRGQSPGISPMMRGVQELSPVGGRNGNNEIVRNASSAAVSNSRPAASLTPQQAIERAAMATVRIRVDEGNTTAHGTGTIVDVHGSEALVLTCGHLFRDMQPGSQLSLDLFAGSAREINLPAQLIDFRAEKEDIGLISFRLPVPLQPVALLPRGVAPQVGQSVFSFGCDHGQVPSRRDTHITNVNRYLGADNIEIGGAPAVGRSGGGLFDLQGRLIGVCNAACAEEDEGIYASASVIYDQIDRLGLGHLFKQRTAPRAESAPGLPDTQMGPSSSEQLKLAGSQRPVESSNPQTAGLLGTSWPDEQVNNEPLTMTPSNGTFAGDSNPTTESRRQNSSAGAAAQLICVVRDAEGRDQVLTIQSPSAQLIEQLTTAAQEN
ncbi:MAG: trypsin-like peptidase domain-containing protein [Aureliella sp.]